MDKKLSFSIAQSVRWRGILYITFAVAALSIFAEGVFTSLNVFTAHRESATYQATLVSLGHLSTRTNYDRVSSIMDLSIEFHFDPTIVMLVDHYSRENVDRNELAWSIVKDHEVVTHIALSLIKIESNGNTFATSNKKAYGLTQLLLPTAQDYEPDVTVAQLYDQETNIRIFFMHFERLLEHYEGNMTKVLHGWNRGEGTVDKLLARNIDPANGFSEAIYKVALTNNRMRIGF